MKKAIFTIVAKNYFGLAEVLGECIKTYNPEVDFHIFIADEITDEATSEKIHYSSYNHICKDTLGIPEKTWLDTAFKYSVTEFCTFLKPFCFEYLFNQKYAKVIYFDPDIFVFNKLDDIFNELDNNFIVLTPHITTIETNYTGDASQTDILGSGIYNLGFLALKNDTRALKTVKWWQNRLSDMCYVDRADCLFTDQKWMDFIFSFFSDGIHISRDLGRNLAPWNFYERKVLDINNELYVINRIYESASTKLLFVHFSGFNYKNLQDVNSNLPDLNMQKYADIGILFKTYESKLLEGRIADFLNLLYSYNYFDNGIQILHLHRRLYRRILIDKRIEFDNPFASNIPDSFFKNLLRKKLVDKTFVNNQMDKMRKDDYDGYYKKVYYINKVFYNLKSALGFKRYYMLTKFFIKYFRPENQYFLFDKNDVSKTL